MASLEALIETTDMAAKKPAPVVTKDMVFITVIALVPVEHDGERHEEGDEFDIPADRVKALADVNAIKVVGEAADDVAETGSAP